ncbi:MAG: prephenate dehydrogenase/arogenate dehydrogenase family protein [Clostridia bacterium]|nr:prephenate dehydrogenase/arogenate dehydrogenase family protein [Clostridia bacterium]
MDCNQIAIVGLGLIGGSVLKALQGFHNAEFFGIDMDADVLEAARQAGLLSKKRLNQEEILAQADVTFICLPPDSAIEFINGHTFKKGSLVTDVCGVKKRIVAGIENKEIDFIGGHPMAGKEESGFFASDGDLFKGASYLITPTPENMPEHVALLKEMIAYMGCRKAVVTTPEEHDDMIAYTSQLMHVVAVVLCDSERLAKASDFSAGSLRDCTRVAKLDSRLWSRLFLQNKEALLDCICEFEGSLSLLKAFLETESEEELEGFLRRCSDRKRQFFKEK